MNNEFSENIQDHSISDQRPTAGRDVGHGHDEVEEEEQAYLAPSRWWLASTAFPLIAGTFGPMASAFSICALVVHWRMIVPPDGNDDDGTFVDDPEWLIAINACQLAVALVANFSLLMNMAKRLRFEIAQPITIIGWYISSLALIGLCATTSGPLSSSDPDVEYTMSGAFYYAIYSAALYFIVATLMLGTVYGAYAGHYKKDFKLTMSQRTLMLQTISFLVYLLSGAAVYSRVEGWNYLDAVYFADYTLLTVGIGDHAPTTHTGRSLLFPFAIGGIIILGLVIGSIRSLVLERGKVKMEARLVEKERERTLKRYEKKGRGFLLTPVSWDSSKTEVNDAPLNERDRRRQEFDLMRRVQTRAGERRRWMALAGSGTTWFGLWFIGAAIFQATEKSAQGWSYFESLYFAYVSLLTVGYGDIYPESNSGKSFFVFWSLLAIPSLTILISNMGDTVVKLIRDLTIWIGTFTVLPGEEGFRAGLKRAVHTLTGGKAFHGDFYSEQPPGFLGEAQRRDNEEDTGNEGKGHHRKNDPESAAGQADEEDAKKSRSKAKRRGDDNDRTAMPKSRKHYHVILIKEIGQVTKHLNASPPRKYTYDEWAWYLKLIGEDESDASMHRRARRKPQRDGVGLGACFDEHEPGEERRKVPWSWVGNRSPLMGIKEEAEWVLERLTRTLERELRKAMDGEVAGREGRRELESKDGSRELGHGEASGTGNNRMKDEDKAKDVEGEGERDSEEDDGDDYDGDDENKT